MSEQLVRYVLIQCTLSFRPIIRNLKPTKFLNEWTPVAQFFKFGTMAQASLAASKQLDLPARLYRLYQTVQYSILCHAADDERLDSFETCRADKKLWNKN